MLNLPKLWCKREFSAALLSHHVLLYQTEYGPSKYLLCSFLRNCSLGPRRPPTSKLKKSKEAQQVQRTLETPIEHGNTGPPSQKLVLYDFMIYMYIYVYI